MLERKLGKTDVTLTSLGLGTSPLGGCNVDVSFPTFEAVVLKAYELGVRYFDTAEAKHTTKVVGVDVSQISCAGAPQTGLASR